MTHQRYRLLDDELEDYLANAHADIQAAWLILGPHQDSSTHWVVNCLFPEFYFEFEPIIGNYRAVNADTLDNFMELADELGYHVAFEEDPEPILAAQDRLEDTPFFELNSSLDGTINGFLPFQLREFNRLKDLECGLAVWSTGPQPLDSKVLTTHGWISMGSLNPGDTVIGSNGNAVTVDNIYDQGNLPVFRVHFSDRTYVDCSENHLWAVEFWSNGSRKLTNRRYLRRETLSVRELCDRPLYLKSGKKSGPHGRAKYTLPLLDPVCFEADEQKRTLPLDPYVVGALLGDGCLTNQPAICTADKEILISVLKLSGATLGAEHRYTYNLCGIRDTLRAIDIYGVRDYKKSIPYQYQFATQSQRLALLQGLLDTDGSPSGSGAEFTSTSKALANGVCDLVRSLGGYAKQASRITEYTYKGEKKQGRESYRTHISLDAKLFRLDRKQSQVRPFKQRQKRIVSIEPLEIIKPMRCIAVHSLDHLYVTEGFALTHNTGKTVLAAALTRYHEQDYDVAFHVVKRHNLINTQRKLKRLANIDSLLVTGPKPWRTKVYTRLSERLRANKPSVVVLNYEKFRDDFSENEDNIWWLSGWGEEFFPNRRLLFIWDEMPMKLKNRNAQLYKGVCNCLYDTKSPQVRADKLRPAKTWQYMTSGTPIENNPADAFNCLRLMDKGETFGPVKEFEAEYVKSYNYFNQYEPEEWHKLDKMHLKIHPYLSVVDKHDPEIAAMFPNVIEEPIYIDWHTDDRKVYDLITKRAEEALEDEEEISNPLALMTVLQMMCDDPTMLNRSATRRSEFEKTLLEYGELDDKDIPAAYGSELALEIISELGPLDNSNHKKLEYLDRILLERHPQEKTLIFSVFSDLLLPELSSRLDRLKIPHVVYAGSDRQKQDAYDQFKQDPDILVFLSSDAGSDSIDLEEATVTIDYDLPWNYSRKVQRNNRNNRVTTKHDTIYSYSFMMNNSIEDRRVEVMATKLGFHEGIFQGVSADAIKAARLDKGDIYYILTGRSSD